MSNVYPVSAPELAREIKIEVELTGYKIFKVRLWLCLQLLRFAAWVGGLGGIEIKAESDIDRLRKDIWSK